MQENFRNSEIINILSKPLKDIVLNKQTAKATNDKNLEIFCDKRIVELGSYIYQNGLIDYITEYFKSMPKSQINLACTKVLETEMTAQYLVGIVRETINRNNKIEKLDIIEKSFCEVSDEDAPIIFKNFYAKANDPSKFKYDLNDIKIASTCLAFYKYDAIENELGDDIEDFDFYKQKIDNIFERTSQNHTDNFSQNIDEEKLFEE